MKQLLFILSIFLAVGCTDKSDVSSEDWEGVVRAAGDLVNDIRMVSGAEPQLIKKHLLFYPNYLNRNNREKPAD